jgi:O-antigen/teichoic acid export membrane protein
VNPSRTGIEPRDVRAELPPERNLRFNTIALILSNLLTGVLGLVFWGAAGRLYPAEEVGIAAALITSAVMLSALSVLSIDMVYQRFLPLAGTRAGPLLMYGFLIVAATATLLGAALVAFGPRDALFDTRWTMACYPVLVMALAVFTLQDGVTVGLGVARWAAAKNSVHAVAKVLVLVVLALAWTDSAVSIVVAWGATAAAAALWVLVAVRRRYRSNPRFLAPPNLPSRSQLFSYFGLSFAITAVWAIGPLVVPLIVVTQVGADANAYFSVSWAIISALYLTVHLVVCPYVAEVAAHPDKVDSLSWRMVRTVIVVICVGSVGLLVVGPAMLGVVGTAYRAHGAGLLYLAAAFVPLSAVGAVYEGFARVRRRLGVVLAVRLMSTLLIVFGSLIGTRSVGVVGVGWAYLAAESLAATVLFVPTVLWLRTVEENCT